jgi:hypothetical protein
VKKVIKVVSVEKRNSKLGHSFYLNQVILDDGETYSVPHQVPAKIGDELECWYSDIWDKLCARYPHPSKKVLHNG